MVVTVLNPFQERLLLESDQNTPRSSVKQLHSMCKIMAEAHGWNVLRTAEITHENAVRFFSFTQGEKG